MAKGIKLNREQYKNVKRMDHKQMETFVVNMYNAGYEDGKNDSGQQGKTFRYCGSNFRDKGHRNQESRRDHGGSKQIIRRRYKTMLADIVEKAERTAGGG